MLARSEKTQGLSSVSSEVTGELTKIFGGSMSFRFLTDWFFDFKSTIISVPEHFSVWECLLALKHNWYCWCKEQHKRDVLLLLVTQTRVQIVSLWLLPSWYIVFWCTIVVYIVLYFQLYRYWICLFVFLGLFFLCFSIKQLDDSTQLWNLLFACVITFQPNNNKVIPSVWNHVVTVSDSPNKVNASAKTSKRVNWKNVI